MKRSGPIERKTPLSRSKKLTSRPRRKRSMGKEDPRWRNARYLAWVRTLPCCQCGAYGCDPHHAIAIGGLSGMGLTAPDQWTIPLCRACHDELHATPTMWPVQWQWVAMTLALAVDQGVLIPGGPHGDHDT